MCARKCIVILMASLGLTSGSVVADVVFHYEGGACGAAVIAPATEEGATARALVNGEAGLSLWGDCRLGQGTQGAAGLAWPRFGTFDRSGRAADPTSAGASGVPDWAFAKSAALRPDLLVAETDDAIGRLGTVVPQFAREPDDDAITASAGRAAARAVSEPPSAWIVLTGLGATWFLRDPYKPQVSRRA